MFLYRLYEKGGRLGEQMILLPQDHASCDMCRKDLPETQIGIRMDRKRAVQTDCTSHSRLHQQRAVGKNIIISRDIQAAFLTLHPVEDLIFRILPSRHDQRILPDLLHRYRLFPGKLMILSDKIPQVSF